MSLKSASGLSSEETANPDVEIISGVEYNSVSVSEPLLDVP